MSLVFRILKLMTAPCGVMEWLKFGEIFFGVYEARWLHKYTLSVIFFPGKGGCVIQATSEICKWRIATSSEMSSVPFGILLPKHNVIYHIISITTLQHAACHSPIIMGCGFSCVCPAVIQVFSVHTKKISPNLNIHLHVNVKTQHHTFIQFLS